MKENAAFLAYSAASLVLTVNLMFLWAYSGLVRAKSKTTRNPEDAKLFKVAEVEIDPPAVARVLRAHQNAMASIVPFFAVGFLFVLAGGPPRVGMILFGAFVVARWMHSLAYLRGLQPWRTLSFATGVVALLGMVVATVSRLA